MVGTYPPRVLIIEDDPVVRGAVQALLDYFGYESGLAADGPSGLRCFDGEPWDLVLTDLTLPGMSGWEVVDAIRGRAPTLPVILITGVDEPMVRTRAVQATFGCSSNRLALTRSGPHWSTPCIAARHNRRRHAS